MTIFTDQEATLDILKEDHLSLLPASFFSGKTPGDQTLWRRLMAAEVEVQRKLGVSLTPVEVFPSVPPTAEEVAELNGAAYIVEPGYDMPADFFGVYNWGIVKLATKPVIEVASVRFVYPGTIGTVYEVPKDWILTDGPRATIQFMPAPTIAGVPASVLSMQALSAGRTMPQMIRVRYRAGLTPEHEAMPDIRDVIMRLSLLRAMKFLPQSGSISADGLSRSVSVDVGKFQDEIDSDLDSLHERLVGLVWGVL